VPLNASTTEAPLSAAPKIRRHGGAADAGNGLNAFHQFPDKRRALNFFVPGRQDQLGGEDVLGIESQAASVKLAESMKGHGGAEEQRHGERDLNDHEPLARARTPHARRRSLASFAENRGETRPRLLGGRKDRDHDRCHGHDGQQEKGHGPWTLDRIGEGGLVSEDRAQRERRHRAAGDRPGHGDGESFDESQPHQLETIGAEDETQRGHAALIVDLRKKEIGDVDARQQLHQQHGDGQDNESRALIAVGRGAKRLHMRGRVVLPFGKFFLKLCGDPLQIRLSLFRRSALTKPPEDDVVPGLWIRDVRWAQAFGNEDVPLGQWNLEITRHHADHAIRMAVHEDGLRQNVAVPSESPLPQSVRDDRHRGVGNVVLGRKIATDAWSHTEEPEDPARDEQALDALRISRAGQRHPELFDALDLAESGRARLPGHDLEVVRRLLDFRVIRLHMDR